MHPLLYKKYKSVTIEKIHTVTAFVPFSGSIVTKLIYSFKRFTIFSFTVNFVFFVNYLHVTV